MVGIGTFDIFIFQFTDKTRIDTRHQHIIQIDEIEIIPPFIICPPPKVTELSTSYTAFVKLCIFLTEGERDRSFRSKIAAEFIHTKNRHPKLRCH